MNGKVITRSELKNSVATQEKMIRAIFHREPQAMKNKLAELKEQALDNLIDRELILTEFEKKVG